MSSHAGRQRGAGRARRRLPGVASLTLGVVLLLVGAALMFYPVVTDLQARGRAADAIDEMRGQTVSDAMPSTEESGTTYRTKEGDPEYARLVAYNQAVLDGTGDQINDPFAFPADELESFGLPDGILGSISVPKMGIKVPLYLGATSENMVYGAGVIAGTSIPLGEDTSNTVIAAHRGGYYGMPMFRDIEDLEPGDQVIIETPWDKLVYRVSDTQVIDPTDADALRVQAGRDMVTLFTCHPYGHNYQRILVHCDRDVTAVAESDASPLYAAWRTFLPGNLASDSPLLNAESVLRVMGLVLALVCAGLLIARAVGGIRARRRARAGSGRERPVGGAHFS